MIHTVDLEVVDGGTIRIDRDLWKDGLHVAIKCGCGKSCTPQYVRCSNVRLARRYLESRCGCGNVLTGWVVIYKPDVILPGKVSRYLLRTQEAKLPIKISCSTECGGTSDVIFVPPGPGKSVVDGSCMKCSEVLTTTVDFII